MVTRQLTNQKVNGSRITYSILSSSSSLLQPAGSAGLVFPDMSRKNNATIAGCCDGIFCIYDKIYRGGNPSFIILWNPTTSEANVLPQQLEVPPHPSEIQIGFGFDPKTEDYKVILGGSYSSCKNIGYIYSLRNNSWRRLDKWINTPNSRFIFNVAQPDHSSRMNRVYWCWRPISEWAFRWTNHFHIGSFDMTNEVCDMGMSLAYPGPHYLQIGATFSMVKEMLVVVTYGDEQLLSPCRCKVRGDDSSSDEEERNCSCRRVSSEYLMYSIWAMLGNERLNFGSRTWTKLFTVSLDYPFRAIPGVWVTGKCFVVDTEEGLHVNDSYNEECGWDLKIKGENSSVQEVIVFVPSTISLSSSS
ncbi:hypothetical protein LINPERHAP2_LOCUS42518 [Linum perenne]